MEYLPVLSARVGSGATARSPPRSRKARRVCVLGLAAVRGFGPGRRDFGTVITGMKAVDGGIVEVRSRAMEMQHWEWEVGQEMH